MSKVKVKIFLQRKASGLTTTSRCFFILVVNCKLLFKITSVVFFSLQILLQHGGDRNESILHGMTPVMYAAQGGHTTCLQALIQVAFI